MNSTLLRGFLALLALLLPGYAAACPELLKHSFPRLQDGAQQQLCQYQGKVLLVVNTASFCGYTGQYEGLEAVYDKYKGRGLVVVGFPSNDFGQQEPGSEKEIAEFCRTSFGIRFPMMAKTAIAPPATHPFYRQLIVRSGAAPQWNFHKYLVDRSGTKVASYASRTAPDDKALLAQLERWLGEK